MEQVAEDLTNVRQYTIRKLANADIAGALRVFASHGLFEARHSLPTYLQIDCNGFYVAIDVTNDEVIGVCGGPFLRPDMAFIGLYAVDSKYFGRGIGQKLFECVMTYIGDRNCCLFAVPDKIPLYRDKLGFGLVSEHRMLIYFGNKISNNSKHSPNDCQIQIKSILSEQLVTKIIEYDQHIHRLNREKLLTLSLREPECLALAAVDPTTDEIVGYGCIRENSTSFATLSPVYANSAEIAAKLCQSLITGNEYALKNGFYYYTISTNESAVRCAEKLGLERHEECPLLFRNAVVDVDYQKIYSIFSPNFSL